MRPRASPGKAADAKRAARVTLTDELGEQLTGWGRVVRLEIRGRSSGEPTHVAVGFLEATDGTLLVAAGEPDAGWARNLEADAHGLATIGDRVFEFDAERLDGREAAEAVVGLILKYGTSAERLGRGAVFRLRPSSEGGQAPA